MDELGGGGGGARESDPPHRRRTHERDQATARWRDVRERAWAGEFGGRGLRGSVGGRDTS